jgi:predicted signal transduction protein with EAL and GGDEF domain/DNA-binding response OmpR family regulator
MKHGKTTTILMADDDPSHLMLTEAALAGAGFMVHTASDGEEAVQRFAELSPDCVVLDVQMPRMTGIEACRAIRRQAGTRAVPVLMLTGRNDLTAISDAYAAGASDFAQKGLNPRLLVERVRFLLRDRELREELRSSQSKLLLAQRIARVGHWELTADGRTLDLSPMVGELLGIDAAGLERYEQFVSLLDPAEREVVRSSFIACATGDGGFGLDHRVRTPDGSSAWLHQEAELVEGTAGVDGGIVIVTLQDLTRLHAAEESVRRLSYFDSATGLPNRRHFCEETDRLLAGSADDGAASVVAFRVHAFDRITQAQGREFGERLVTEAGRRIEEELGRIAKGGTIAWHSGQSPVCRTADGELAVLVRCRETVDHLATVTRAVLESLSASALPANSEFSPAISAGVALAGADGANAAELLGKAHAAAETASVPRSCAFFSSVPQSRLRRRLQVESALRAAVPRGELELHFQPRVAVDTFETTSLECFVRWDHPEFGSLPHGEFVAIAEESGVAEDIGRWAIEEACRRLAGWREHYVNKFRVSFGLGRAQLRDPRLPDFLRSAIDRHRLPPDALQLEVSEASLADAPDTARATLAELSGHGVRIGLLDFGTGYCSLGQIRRVPFGSMKLSPALVTNLYVDPWTQGVTAAVVAMARAMNMRAVADHIDDEATFDMLRALGCDEMQGRHVAAPMKAREFEHWLETGGAAHLARAAAPDLSRALEGVDLADGDLPDEDLPEDGFPDDGLPDRSLTMTR